MSSCRFGTEVSVAPSGLGPSILAILGHIPYTLTLSPVPNVKSPTVSGTQVYGMCPRIAVFVVPYGQVVQGRYVALDYLVLYGALVFFRTTSAL